MKKQVFLLFLFSLLLVSFTSGAFRYYEPYYSGYSFGSFSNYFNLFLDFIQENQYVVDAVTFLIIFLILAKKALGERFKDEKALYIVIGVALTIGIMMYEREKLGYSLIINSGWLSLIALVIFGAYIASSSGKWSPLRMITLALLALIGLHVIPPLLPAGYYNLVDPIYFWGNAIGFVVLVIGIVLLLFQSAGREK